jgi:hypothetical protein
MAHWELPGLGTLLMKEGLVGMGVGLQRAVAAHHIGRRKAHLACFGTHRSCIDWFSHLSQL